MKNNLPITNFVLYGSQISTPAVLAYQNVFNRIQLKLKNSCQNFFFTNPSNFDSVMKDLIGPTIFFPLFLMDGVEYKKILHQINCNFPFEKIVISPISEYPFLLKNIFVGNLKTIFLMHGSNQYENLEKHAKMISSGKSLGYQNYCFLEGTNHYKEFIKIKLLENELVQITPLLFVSGNHINSDLIDGLLNLYPPNKWNVNPSLLERPEIIATIAEIAAFEMLNENF